MSATARILTFSRSSAALLPGSSAAPVATRGTGRHADAVRRYGPALRRWLHGRLPARAHRQVRPETVERAVVHAVERLDVFEGGYAIAIQSALRQAVLDRVGDACRDSAHPAATPSPLERVIGGRAVARYERALCSLPPEDRAAIIARLEMAFSYGEIAKLLGSQSPAAARSAVTRALLRLAEGMRDGD